MDIKKSLDNTENICQKIGQTRKNGQILDTCNFPRLNKEEIDSLNILIACSGIEFVVKKSEQLCL